eukprot:435021-Prorocentrum_minimum.AAC.1
MPDVYRLLINDGVGSITRVVDAPDSRQLRHPTSTGGRGGVTVITNEIDADNPPPPYSPNGRGPPGDRGWKRARESSLGLLVWPLSSSLRISESIRIRTDKLFSLTTLCANSS